MSLFKKHFSSRARFPAFLLLLAAAMIFLGAGYSRAEGAVTGQGGAADFLKFFSRFKAGPTPFDAGGSGVLVIYDEETVRKNFRTDFTPAQAPPKLSLSELRKRATRDFVDVTKDDAPPFVQLHAQARQPGSLANKVSDPSSKGENKIPPDSSAQAAVNSEEVKRAAENAEPLPKEGGTSAEGATRQEVQLPPEISPKPVQPQQAQPPANPQAVSQPVQPPSQPAQPQAVSQPVQQPVAQPRSSFDAKIDGYLQQNLGVPYPVPKDQFFSTVVNTAVAIETDKGTRYLKIVPNRGGTYSLWGGEDRYNFGLLNSETLSRNAVKLNNGFYEFTPSARSVLLLRMGSQ